MSDIAFILRVFMPAAVALFFGLSDPLRMYAQPYYIVNIRMGLTLLAVALGAEAVLPTSAGKAAIGIAAWIVGLGLLLTPFVARGWIAWQVALGAMKWPLVDDDRE